MEDSAEVNIGVIASRRGIGKTACLVHLATDKLLAGKHVIHVSYSKRTDHIIDWYEDIFREISKKRDLEDAMTVHDEIVHNRVIMNFSQQGSSVGQVLAGVSAMIEYGQTDTDIIVIDGFDFTRASKQDIKDFDDLASQHGLEIWFSDSYHRKDIDGPALDKNGIPQKPCSLS